MVPEDWLLERAIAGDKHARDALIGGLAELVRGKARRFVDVHYDSRERYDDLCQEGMVAAIESVDSLIAKRKPVAAIRAYVAVVVQHAFIRCRARLPLISCSDSTISRSRKAGQPAPTTRTTSCDFPRLIVDATTDFETEDRTRLKSDGRGGMQKRLARAGTDELLERVSECCLDDRDEKVVEMRLAGHDDDEIAAALDVSKRTVLRIRKAIEKRFDAAQSQSETPLALGA